MRAQFEQPTSSDAKLRFRSKVFPPHAPIGPDRPSCRTRPEIGEPDFSFGIKVSHMTRQAKRLTCDEASTTPCQRGTVPAAALPIRALHLEIRMPRILCPQGQQIRCGRGLFLVPWPASEPTPSFRRTAGVLAPVSTGGSPPCMQLCPRPAPVCAKLLS